MTFVKDNELYFLASKERVLEKIKKKGTLSGSKKRIKMDENLILFTYNNFLENFLDILGCMACEALETDMFDSRGAFFEDMLKKLPDDLEGFLIDRYIDFVVGGCNSTFVLQWDGTYKMVKQNEDDF